MMKRTPSRANYGKNSERFWRRVLIGDDCWLWQGGTSHKGGKISYGVFYLDGRMISAHRAAWELWYGEPSADCVLHKCDVPLCVRPDHLFEGSRAENSRDMSMKGRSPHSHVTQCIRGHEYTEENTYRRPDGTRECRTCRRLFIRKARS